METLGRVVVALIAVCTAGCGGASERGPAATPVRLAVGGQTQMVYLPTTLAQELGFYRDEGLAVELQDFQGGAKALQALIGGSADVVSGFYDHTIQMAAEGRPLVAFVTMLRYPGLVLATAPGKADTIQSVADLRGRIAGVTTAGSSSQMFLNYLLTRAGVPADTVSVTAIGSAATAVAAVERGKVDAGWMADPAFTLLKRRSPHVRVLADLRTAEGVKAAFGTTTYPAAVLYTNRQWFGDNRETCARLARAIARTLDWMQTHSAEEIAGRTPKSLRGDDDALYVEALKASMAMFSADGTMSADGAAAVRTLLAQSNDKVRGATIELSNTFTNELIHGR